MAGAGPETSTGKLSEEKEIHVVVPNVPFLPPISKERREDILNSFDLAKEIKDVFDKIEKAKASQGGGVGVGVGVGVENENEKASSAKPQVDPTLVRSLSNAIYKSGGGGNAERNHSTSSTSFFAYPVEAEAQAPTQEEQTPPTKMTPSQHALHTSIHGGEEDNGEISKVEAYVTNILGEWFGVAAGKGTFSHFVAKLIFNEIEIESESERNGVEEKGNLKKR